MGIATTQQTKQKQANPNRAAKKHANEGEGPETARDREEPQPKGKAKKRSTAPPRTHQNNGTAHLPKLGNTKSSNLERAAISPLMGLNAQSR